MDASTCTFSQFWRLSSPLYVRNSYRYVQGSLLGTCTLKKISSIYDFLFEAAYFQIWKKLVLITN
jgi:hypothetical protein